MLISYLNLTRGVFITDRCHKVASGAEEGTKKKTPKKKRQKNLERAGKQAHRAAR